MECAEDREYYIDFATVRGDKVIDKLKRTITRLSPNQPTCQRFTGHIGCGKSTDEVTLNAVRNAIAKREERDPRSRW